MNGNVQGLRVTFETVEERLARDLEAERRLRALRTRKALTEAHVLARHLRRHVLETISERGLEVAQEVTPLSSVKADDADELYTRLVDWVSFWSRWLDFQPTGAVAIAWSRIDPSSKARDPQFETLGFRAGTSAAAASLLVSAQAQWLLRREAQIVLHPAAEEYQDDVVSMIWGFRARYRLTPAREKPVRPHVCPLCGEPALAATWWSADILDVTIGCEHCGHEIPTPRPSEIERYLQESAGTPTVLSVACAAGDHAGCDSVICRCACHSSGQVDPE